MILQVLLSSHLALASGMATDLITTRVALRPAVFHLAGYQPIRIQITRERCICGESMKAELAALGTQAAIVELAAKIASRNHSQMANRFVRIFGLFHFGLAGNNLFTIRSKAATVRKYEEDSNR